VKSRITQIFALALFAMFSGVASAATTTVSIANNSWDVEGAAVNESITVDLAALLGQAGDVLVTGIGWDIALETVGASWQSEATIGFGSGGVNQIVLSPGNGVDMPGMGNYASPGVVNLVDLDLAFTVTDGLLTIEFFESFDDVADSIDAILSGTLEIEFEATAIPVPAAVWLFASGILGLVGARRRA